MTEDNPKTLNVIDVADAALALHGALMDHLGFLKAEQRQVIKRAIGYCSTKPGAQSAIRTYFQSAFD